jgi:hypothetical protein
MFQIAYVVPDLRSGMEQCKRIFGVDQFLVLNDVAFANHQLRGRASNARQNVAFGFASSANLELIEPLDGESIYSEFLLTHSQGGFHHIGYKVADFETARQTMLSDFEELQSGRFGMGTYFSYFDTVSAIGHVTELLFFDEETELLFERLKVGQLPGEAEVF